MRGFYNYDTRGVSEATQIVNLERMVEERDAEIERLRDLLSEAAITERIERAVAAERVKVEQEVAGVLREIAAVTHSGGLVGMTEATALIAVRKLTLPYWSRSTREDEITLLRGEYREDKP